MNKKFIEWSDNYSVRVKEIDEQHKILIAMLNDLYSAFMNKVHQEKVVEIIAKMAEYAALHFATEEEYFMGFEYPEMEEHIVEHNDFVAQVIAFMNELENNRTSLTFQVLTFLQKWLTNHILGSDMKYSDFFIENGVK